MESDARVDNFLVETIIELVTSKNHEPDVRRLVIQILNTNDDFFVTRLIEYLESYPPITMEPYDSGTWSYVFQSDRNPETVVRIPRMSKYEEHRSLLTDFLRDSILNALLYSISEQVLDIPCPFVKIHRLGLTTHKGGSVPFSVLQRCEFNFAEIMIHYKKEKSLLIQCGFLMYLVYIMMLLQRYMKFMHGDFHAKNVMMVSEPCQIYFPDKNKDLFGITFPLSIKLIDFGDSYCDLRDEMPIEFCSIILEKARYKSCSDVMVHYTRSYDIRIFFASVFGCLLPELKNLFTPLYRKYEGLQDIPFQHRFYTINYDTTRNVQTGKLLDEEPEDPDFFPENVFNMLLEVWSSLV